MRPLDFICGACHEEIKLKEFTILLCGHLLCASCAGESMQTMNGYQQMQCRCGIQTCFRVQQPEFVAKKQMQDGEIDMAIYTECRG